MKKYIVLLLLTFVSSYCLADQYVNGYTRKDGTYVEGHQRTNANSSTYDNYSSQGNTNPYTGERGYKRNDDSYSSGYDSSNSNRNSGNSLYGNYGNR